MNGMRASRTLKQVARFVIAPSRPATHIRPYPRTCPVSPAVVSSWTQAALPVLSNLFQMTVTGLTKYSTPVITIAKSIRRVTQRVGWVWSPRG